jgi:RimJ/RimL family protein N-acetyltransferase
VSQAVAVAPPIRLETERLIIRPFAMGDLDEIYDLVYADPQVKTMWSGLTGAPEQIKVTFFERHVRRVDDFGFKAIDLADGNRLLGLIGFQRYKADEDLSWLVFEHGPPARWRDQALIEVELTYALGRQYWGHGYATEAGRAMIAYGFKEMGIARIVNSVMGTNARSIRLMARLGLHLQKNLNPAHDPQDVVGILENREWPQAGDA